MIRGLEASLDIQLFNRTTRRVSLTGAGAAFLQHAEQALAPINAAVQTLQSSHEELRNSLRIAAPRSVAEHMILLRLPEFRKVHPLIELELFTEAALTDIVAREWMRESAWANVWPRTWWPFRSALRSSR